MRRDESFLEVHRVKTLRRFAVLAAFVATLYILDKHFVVVEKSFYFCNVVVNFSVDLGKWKTALVAP